MSEHEDPTVQALSRLRLDLGNMYLDLASRAAGIARVDMDAGEAIEVARLLSIASGLDTAMREVDKRIAQARCDYHVRLHGGDGWTE